MEDPTPDEVAAWMLAEIEKEGELLQSDAAYSIRERFGEDFIYRNAGGNDAIDPKVLSAFRKLSGDKVVWNRRSFSWARREPHHDPGRSQDW